MTIFCKKIAVALLLALFLASGVLAAPVEFVNLKNYGIFGGRNISLTVSARGKQAVSYEIVSRVGGILFQAVAIPSSSAEGKPVNIEYRANQPDGQRLIVYIGDTAVTVDMYDWQIIPTALFAATEDTACMTLLGHPKTQEERLLCIENPTAYMFAEFHPKFINTLTGINLFFVDAMLVDGNTNRIRQITSNLSGIIPGYNDISIDEDKSAAGATHIRRLLFATLNNWESYIYTDYGTDIWYEIINEKLVFTGFPSYLFILINRDTETVTINSSLSAQIRKNIERLRSINPIIYRAAEQTAQWAAFFRMVKEQYPQVWESFIAQINNAEPIMQIETPRYWKIN